MNCPVIARLCFDLSCCNSILSIICVNLYGGHTAQNCYGFSPFMVEVVKTADTRF